MCLLRPAIIASSMTDPFPGWTDSLAAAGGITLLVGLGLINYIHSKLTNPFDIVPVDTVTNSILVASAYGASEPGKMLVYNCGTSNENHVTMLGYKDHVDAAYTYHKFNQQVFPVYIQFIKNKTEYQIKKALNNDLPVAAINKLAQLPIIGTPSLKKSAKQLKMVQEKTENALDIMHFFINGEWNYVNRRIYKPLEMLSSEERSTFDCDVRQIKWSEYIHDYVKGLSIWALKEDQVAPSCGFD